jgi:hypothetical protein
MHRIARHAAAALGITAAAAAHAASGAASPPAVATEAASAGARSCQATSPSHRVALVELFTSEGCSSCPPADRWLSSLRAAGFGFDRVVPLSLHVGYWDYIGWKDPYAKPVFTERQRRYAHARGSTSVYTPQVVLDGRDYRAWGSSPGFARDVAAINGLRAPMGLRIAATQTGGAVAVEVATLAESADRAPDGDAMLTIAVFEDRLNSRVTRGENAGETLGHDHVVREWFGPIALPARGAATARRVDLPAGLVASNAGVAAFVQRTDGSVLQAVACLFR